jgi:hypothetical protein
MLGKDPSHLGHRQERNSANPNVGARLLPDRADGARLPSIGINSEDAAAAGVAAPGNRKHP